VTGRDLPDGDVAIVGFEGSFAVECGLGLPLALHLPTQRYFKLDDTSPSLPRWYDRDEVDAIERARLVTLIPRPLAPVPEGVVVFATHPFLETAGLDVPERVGEHPLRWQPVLADGQRAHVAYLPEPQAHGLLDGWGRHLCGQADAALREYFRTRQASAAARAEELADLGICAALDPSLRGHLYLHIGVAVMMESPAGLKNWHECIVQPEIPQWSWDRFRDEVEALGQNHMARVRIMADPEPMAASEPVDEIVDQPVAVVTGERVDEIAAAPVPLPPDLVRHLSWRLMTTSARLKVNDPELKVLREVLAPDVFAKVVDGSTIDTPAFIRDIRHAWNHSTVDRIVGGDLGRYLKRYMKRHFEQQSGRLQPGYV